MSAGDEEDVQLRRCCKGMRRHDRLADCVIVSGGFGGHGVQGGREDAESDVVSPGEHVEGVQGPEGIEGLEARV